MTARFEVVKKQELKQRKMIETVCVKMLNTQKLKKVFWFFKSQFEKKRIYERKQKIAGMHYFSKLKNRFFNSWKSLSVSEPVVVKKLSLNGEREKKTVEEGYSQKLTLLKCRIVEVEQKTELADKSVQYFMDGISSSYRQAITFLNSELISMQKTDPSCVIRFNKNGPRISADLKKPHISIPLWIGGNKNPDSHFESE